MKYIIPLLLAILLIGCGNDEPEATPVPAVTSEPTRVPPTATPEPFEIMYSENGYRFLYQSDWAVVDGLPLDGPPVMLTYRFANDPSDLLEIEGAVTQPIRTFNLDGVPSGKIDLIFNSRFVLAGVRGNCMLILSSTDSAPSKLFDRALESLRCETPLPPPTLTPIPTTSP